MTLVKSQKSINIIGRENIIMIISVVIGIILGIAIPILIPSIFNVALDLGAQIIIGLLAGILPVLIEIQKSLEILKKTKKDELTISEIKNSFDVELQRISRNYLLLDDVNEQGIFSTYFMKEVKTLSEDITDAANKKNFMGKIQNFVDEKYIMDCFGNSTNKTWRFPWEINSSKSPIEDCSDEGWIAYWNHAIRLMDEKKILYTEIIFIAKDSIIEDIKKPTSPLRQYLNGLSCKKSVKAKLISFEAYLKSFQSAFNQSNYNDFGIYGDNMLFIYNNDRVEYGWYIKNSYQIKQYLAFFDTVYREAFDLTS